MTAPITAPTSLDRALSLLYAAMWAMLVRLCVWAALVPTLGHLSFSSMLFRVEQGVAFAVEGFAAFAWIVVARAVPPARRGLPSAAAALATLSFVASIALELLPLRVDQPVVFYATMLLWLVLLPLSWHALLGLGEARGLRRADGATAVVWMLFAARLAIRGARLGHLTQGPTPMLEYAGLGASIGGAALLLWLTARVRAARGEATADGAPAATVAPPAGNDVLVGALWLGGGLLVTVVSYAAAAHGGGRYFVSTGAIAYGLVRLVRGLGRG